jgi:hypothetical protein
LDCSSACSSSARKHIPRPLLREHVDAALGRRLGTSQRAGLGPLLALDAKPDQRADLACPARSPRRASGCSDAQLRSHPEHPCTPPKRRSPAPYRSALAGPAPRSPRHEIRVREPEHQQLHRPNRRASTSSIDSPDITALQHQKPYAGIRSRSSPRTRREELRTADPGQLALPSRRSGFPNNDHTEFDHSQQNAPRVRARQPGSYLNAVVEQTAREQSHARHLSAFLSNRPLRSGSNDLVVSTEVADTLLTQMACDQDGSWATRWA